MELSISQEHELEQIKNISQNARTTWLGLLGLLAYVGIILLAHKDADFFAFGSTTQLPIIGVTVPVESFFLTAPILITALYGYLHLNLVALWCRLGEIEATINEKPISEWIHPWLINYAAIWFRARKRQDGAVSIRPLGWLVVAMSLILIWIFGLLALVALWIQSMPAHLPLVTSVIAACLMVSLAIGWSSLTVARRELGRANFKRWHAWMVRAGSGIAVILFLVASYETTRGSGLWTDRTTGLPVFLVRANLTDAQLTSRPADWQSWENWLGDYRAKWNRERREAWRAAEIEHLSKKWNIAPDKTPPPGALEESRAFRADAILRYRDYIATLDAPDLRGRDLRGAIATRVFLPGADLRGARLDGGIFANGDFQGSNLEGATVVGSVYQEAKMQGSTLERVRFHRTILINAEMELAACGSTSFIGSHLDSANLRGCVASVQGFKGAIGSLRTILPPGRELPTCFEPGELNEFEQSIWDLPRARQEWEWAFLPEGKTFENGPPMCDAQRKRQVVKGGSGN